MDKLTVLYMLQSTISGSSALCCSCSYSLICCSLSSLRSSVSVPCYYTCSFALLLAVSSVHHAVAVLCCSHCCSFMSCSLSVYQFCLCLQHTVPYHEFFTCSISALLFCSTWSSFMQTTPKHIKIVQWIRTLMKIQAIQWLEHRGIYRTKYDTYIDI